MPGWSKEDEEEDPLLAKESVGVDEDVVVVRSSFVVVPEKEELAVDAVVALVLDEPVEEEA